MERNAARGQSYEPVIKGELGEHRPRRCIWHNGWKANAVYDYLGMAEQVVESDEDVPGGKCALAGEGLNIGHDGASPVTWDYPGERPWAFAGGTIKQVVVEVSGEPYIDLEKEATAVLSRE